MGTRGMVGAIADGRLFGAYVHVDADPDALGAKVVQAVEEIRKDGPRWKAKATALRVVDSEAAPTAEELAACRWTRAPEAGTGADWYALLRQFQGHLTDYLELGIIPDDAAFVKDSLHCEYAYVADLDREVLILLRGFNGDKARQAPHPWCRLSPAEEKEQEARAARGVGPCYGCALVAELPFARVTHEAVGAAYAQAEAERAKAERRP